ncbi:MAG: MBL fold metallo-hydrolase [Actinomycetota bacterium]|nr:MBL fold metallo-hydrolase [Actinomycetota bacterium]
MSISFEKGLFEVADRVHAYTQPAGNWGYSNAGLVVGDGVSVLVDTLFDLRLTAEMLAAMSTRIDSNRIATVVNTHANGDHCYGNQLVAGDGVDIISSVAALHEMEAVPPAVMASLMSADAAPVLRRFLDAAFGPFVFEGIDLIPPTRTFSGELELDVGGRRVTLLEVGPAHTGGDVIAWLPDDGVVFTGDILFVGGTPIMWAGPISNWVRACERIDALAPTVVVPGHGPITDLDGVREVANYLRFVRDGVIARHGAGMSPDEATRDLDLEINGTRFNGWTDRERLVVTVHNAWSEVEPGFEAPAITDLFMKMAEDFDRHHPPAVTVS